MVPVPDGVRGHDVGDSEVHEVPAEPSIVGDEQVHGDGESSLPVVRKSTRETKPPERLNVQSWRGQSYDTSDPLPRPANQSALVTTSFLSGLKGGRASMVAVI